MKYVISIILNKNSENSKIVKYKINRLFKMIEYFRVDLFLKLCINKMDYLDLLVLF